MNRFVYVFFFFVLLLLTGCSHGVKLEPVVVEPALKTPDFADVKPILDKRCVVCHSCYNSPCQAKMSSFEGIMRGATKARVYDATRLRSVEPTRLFVDAQTTQEWREKNFYSLVENLDDVNETVNDSIMLHLLYDKQEHPEIVGTYAPEYDTLICPATKKELEEYLRKKPNHGMPYGFPAIQEKEYKTLAAWIQAGTPLSSDYDALKRPSQEAMKMIRKWEDFLNRKDPKHQMTARYLYEHLYLSHIYFGTAEREFFEIVRSKTAYPRSIEIIPTLRAFDDPKEDVFYYRFRKVHSSIVHKTHMVVRFDDEVLQRYNELFIQSKWTQPPHLMSYEPKLTKNPLEVFKQIPAESRYRFLLDNSRYIVMTFIRGPVCRGQMALNVIHDHFWVFFRDPKYDVSVLDAAFIESEAFNLELPIENVDEDVFETFSDEYRKRYMHYFLAKKEAILKHFPQGFGLESIYKGEKEGDAPALTVYRHFDSASVSRGLLGEEPRTMWVIDYAQFERLYYTLVAGYNVYGNIAHQTNIRRYMDFLRMEGELNFLDYMPAETRLAMFRSWYQNDYSLDDKKYKYIDKIPSKISYRGSRYKNEFVSLLVKKHFLKELHISFDMLNYKANLSKNIALPAEYKGVEDYIQAARAITLPGSGFVRYVTDKGANNMLLKIEFKDGTYITKDLVINRWHDNVNSLFLEDLNLDSSKDTMDILNTFVGSYPNVFIVVKFEELPEFLDFMKNVTGSEEDMRKFKKFFISRADPKFWEYYDWFQKEFDKQEGVEAGLYDLNRYARSPWQSSR